jgi:hypothetical protein
LLRIVVAFQSFQCEALDAASRRHSISYSLVVPLECGGADVPSNMQWQTEAEAKVKDRTERNAGENKVPRDFFDQLPNNRTSYLLKRQLCVTPS